MVTVLVSFRFVSNEEGRYARAGGGVMIACRERGDEARWSARNKVERLCFLALHRMVCGRAEVEFFFISPSPTLLFEGV